MVILNYPPAETSRLAEDSRERLNLAWSEAVRSFAPHLGGLRDYLSSRLSAASKARQADGPRLLRIVDDAVERAGPSCATNVAEALERRLRQAVYEHLLEVDAISSLPPSLPPPHPPLTEAPPPPAPPMPAEPLVAAQLAAEPVAAEPVAAPAPPPQSGWRIREQTPAGHRQTGIPGGELVDARRRIGDWLHHKRYAEAAALVQRICAGDGGADAVQLAMETGERCRGRGKKMAATSCYLAALRADPTSEAALMQLAEICIDDSDLELAVSHLERIAQLALLRGDEGMALRMYRRIVTIAPERDDILGLLMRTQMAMQDRNLHPRR